MKLPRNISGQRLIRGLERMGYAVARQRGSHVRMTNDSPPHAITVPMHNPIKTGTLSAILRELEQVHRISRTDLLTRLFG